MSPYVIGVAGQAQMGKDTFADCVADVLAKEGHEIKRTAFAYEVKKVYCETFGVTMDFIEKWKTVSEPPPGFDLPVRQGLQFIGDGFRKIRSTIWVDKAFANFEITGANLMFSDVRYVNEFTKIKLLGGFNVLVGRPDRLNDDPNGSEAQIRPFVDWAMKNCPRGKKVWQIQIDESCPSHMGCFDLFVWNDTSKEEFLESIQSEAILYLRDFVESFAKKSEQQ